jgi:hypothetical protein
MMGAPSLRTPPAITLIGKSRLLRSTSWMVSPTSACSAGPERYGRQAEQQGMLFGWLGAQHLLGWYEATNVLQRMQSSRSCYCMAAAIPLAAHVLPVIAAVHCSSGV